MTWKLQDQLSNGFKNAKDPITNPYNDNNFMGAIEMNVGEISLKAPATNWGDNYTSTTANVVDTVFIVQDVFS